jgi:hypothetical protein
MSQSPSASASSLTSSVCEVHVGGMSFSLQPRLLLLQLLYLGDFVTRALQRIC